MDRRSVQCVLYRRQQEHAIGQLPLDLSLLELFLSLFLLSQFQLRPYGTENDEEFSMISLSHWARLPRSSKRLPPLFLTFLGLFFLSQTATSASTSMQETTVVLVHGAWADGSSWSRVIPILEKKGLHVVAVQNPLSSLADDVAATNRVVNMQKGPVILVGHSWAGVVITQAGNNDKVTGLVYVSAFAPDTGQSINDLIGGNPPPPYFATLSKDERGFLYLAPDSVRQYFAPDVPAAVQDVMIATQGPWFYGCLADKVEKASWHTKPSWWVLSQNDQILDPRLQEKMAAGLNAKVTRVGSSHVPMLSKPEEVAATIIAAASSAK
jgi:pimeloyl-ACP methyl ester carboxylesterase